MKQTITILISLLVVSCKNIEHKELIGSWKMIDIIDQTGQNASEKTTFYNGDSLSIEFFTNKKLTEKLNYQYKFDTISNMIRIQFGKLEVSDFKVIKLTNSEMELLNVKQKRAFRYMRP